MNHNDPLDTIFFARKKFHTLWLLSGLSSFSLAYWVFSPMSTYNSEANFYHFQYYQPPEVPTNTLVQGKLLSMQQMGVVHTLSG